MTELTVLVTGGAGYVGSIVARQLLNAGYNVIIVDNFQQGHREAVPGGAELVTGDIRSAEVLNRIFHGQGIGAVVHLAADSIVEDSMRNPGKCFENNIIGGINLLNAMLEHGVSKLIFSSSAAIYGEPQSIPITEEHRKEPVNTYGESKYMFERILLWYGLAYGIEHVSLRYFNAAGASDEAGEDHRPETHLIPNVLAAAVKDEAVTVYGDDYPTADGSCVRDYVHVLDIAQAHVLALEKAPDLSGRAYNLGSGTGCSVFEVVEAARKVTGREISINAAPRRAGDPAVLVASCDKAKDELGWRPEFDRIGDIIESAWRWKLKYPDGYRD